MRENENIKRYKKVLSGRLGNVEHALRGFMDLADSQQHHAKQIAARRVLSKIEQFRVIVRASNFPEWAQQLHTHFDRYLKQMEIDAETATEEIVQAIVRLNAQIEKQNWDFVDSDSN